LVAQIRARARLGPDRQLVAGVDARPCRLDEDQSAADVRVTLTASGPTTIR
jgi:hypothetical protein